MHYKIFRQREPKNSCTHLILYIAEKPSLGKAIAAALPKPHKIQKGYIEAANGDTVSWCVGHILEQVSPEVYKDEWKKWQLEQLPIIPEKWQLKPKYQTRAQLTVLRKLVKQATSIVHAGDPDREGQLLVDEVIDYLKVNKTKKQSVKRLLISDLNIKAVTKALKNLQNNQDFISLSVSALARSRADWLYGINLTRAYSIHGQKAGYHGVLSVGRVQTPILGLVVKRDKEIEAFQPHPYFEVDAKITTSNQENFTAKWLPSEACAPYMDTEGRILNKALAQNVVSRITDQPAKVMDIKSKNNKLNAPLPYSLSSLQIDAAKAFSMNAKLVLDVAQSLYEKHKLITYPRSDCRYLPTDHFKQAPLIISILKDSKEPYANFATKADPSIKSKAWSNSKVGAHHAIIPTEKNADNCSLNTFEKNIYQLIVRQYLAQFFPNYLFQDVTTLIEIAGGKFQAKTKNIEQLGWKELFTSKKSNNKNTQDFPPLTIGQNLFCPDAELLEKETKAPNYFTDATLLAALTGISRFVINPEVKKILKDTDGLGTEATRAGIIELLFKRNFLLREGKSIKATDIGKSLISCLPTECSSPDLTAQWEAQLKAICSKTVSYQGFMGPLEISIGSLIDHADKQSFDKLPKQPFKRKRKMSKSKKNKYTK